MNIIFSVLAGFFLTAPVHAGPVKAAEGIKEQPATTSGAQQKAPAVETKSTAVPAGIRANKSALKAKAKKPGAKLTRAQAEKIALERAKGAVVKEAELEKEHGKLVWSFDLDDAGKVREIQVDAVSGSIVEDKLETQKEEQAEQAQDAAKK